MNLGMELRLRQHLAVTPQLQQALRLLQLSSLEFSEEIQQVLAENPFLEDEAEAPAGRTLDPMADTAPATGTDSDAPAESEPLPDWRVADSPSGGSGGSEDGEDWTNWSEAPQSLREQLRRQLLLLPLGPRDRTLTDLIIDELTDTGYLETPLEELAALLPPEAEVDVRELQAALHLVQQLEPPGIAARNLRECLLLQLRALPPETRGRPLALALIEAHFDLLARRDFAHLQQRLGCDDSALHGARNLIRRLDPKPGRRYGPDDTRYVVPDIIVTRQRGQWLCTLNPNIQPRLRINQAYAEIAARRGACDAGFTRQLQEARWFLRNIEQRFSTIQRVATAIVTKQRAFFNYGDAAMKPLLLRDVSSELGLHESTVCRVTNGKYMATPRGLFEFKYFFSRQLATEDGGTCSALAIRALLKELIAAEDPAAPLSDAQLARLLAEQGLRLARRTVTKYRTLMRLPSVELRRAGAGTRIAAP